MKRLITDHDVLTGAVAPPLLLDEHTLITPSARDRAARLGWAIVEAGARAAPAMAGVERGDAARASGASSADCGGAPRCARCGNATCAGSCGGAPGDGLADGLYLVRIEGGRRVSVLPAAGPGVMTRALTALPPSLRSGG